MFNFCWGSFFVLMAAITSEVRSLDEKTQQKILASSFEGNWQMTGDKQDQTGVYSPFNERIMNAGSAIIYLNSDNRTQGNISNVVIEFLMPEYYDQKMIRLIIRLDQPYNDELQRWESRQKCSYEIYDQTLQTQHGHF